MKYVNRLKAKLKNGERVFGTWSMLGSPSVMNVIGNSGLDFIIIDKEHGPVSFETAELQIYSAETSGCTPIIRLGQVSEQDILNALEIGVQSIMVSHISTEDEAARVANATRYFPDGDRGLSPFTRNHGYSTKNISEKLKHANEQMFVGLLVEGSKGLDNLEKICKTKNVDMVYIGIYDLAQSVGVSGDVKHPKVLKILNDCVKIIKENGLIAGTVAPDKEYLNLLVKTGVQFIAYKVDSAILLEGYELVKSWFDDLNTKEFTK